MAFRRTGITGHVRNRGHGDMLDKFVRPRELLYFYSMGHGISELHPR